MSDIPVGVTRYPVRFDKTSTSIRTRVWVVAALVLVVGVTSPIVLGGSALVAVVLAALGVGVPALSSFLPWWARPLVVVAATVALATRTDWGSDLGPAYAAAYACAFVTGILVAWRIGGHRLWRERLAAAEGAEPSGLDPRAGADVGVLMTWADTEHSYEAVDPDLDIALRAVRSLDGDERTLVTIYRGRGRLDVGGDAGSGLVVQQVDDRRRWQDGYQLTDPRWPQLFADQEREHVSTVTVVVAGERVEHPSATIASLPQAEDAVRSWLISGSRDPEQHWWNPPGRRTRVRRPAALQEHDQPGSSSSASGDVSYMFD